jgi:uncharacterized protein (DUF1330 family)
MPDAYLIVESQITDPEAFKRYAAAAPEAAKLFEGEYLVRGGRMQVLEGDWQPPRLTVLRYPSFEHARAMYDSPAYVHARSLRHGATACFNMVLVEGVEAAPVIASKLSQGQE